MSRYLTVGMLLVEDVVLPDGTEVPGRLGGDALYAAVGARAFADDVQMAVRLGRGFPTALIRALDDAGLGGGLIPSPHETIRLRIEWGVEDGARFTFRSGSYADSTPVAGEIPASLLTDLDAVHIAPVPFDQMVGLVRWARPRTRLLTLDPHYEHMGADWSEILPLVDAFLPSRAEAAELLGGWTDGEQTVRALAALGASTAVVKLGAEGSVGLRGTELVRLPAATADPVDPTGCGDAYCGGFLVGLAESGDLRTAMAHGTVAAGFVADGHGAAHALAVDRDEAARRVASLAFGG